jgi:CheY-like chemotaxis protein
MSKRILVVEDQPDSRQIIRDMLVPTDYEITEAENGEQALAAIAKQRPDLILMDIQLPIMDGYAATRRIKSDPTLRSIITTRPPKSRRACAKAEKRSNCKRTRGVTAKAMPGVKFEFARRPRSPHVIFHFFPHVRHAYIFRLATRTIRQRRADSAGAVGAFFGSLAARHWCDRARTGGHF